MRTLNRTMTLFARTWLALIPASAYAQASLSGVVRDTSGAVLPGVTVEASSPVLIEKLRTATTDGTGQYRIVDLRAGTYSVTFQRVQQATWSSPVTSRFLIEAGFGTYLARYGSNEVPGNPTRDMMRVSEQCTAGCAVNGNIPGLIYRSHDWEYNWNGAHRWHASGSYVTGAHSMKFGYEGAFLAYEPMAFTNNLELSYQVNNGVPNQLTQTLNPFQRFDHVKYGAVFGQEQWTRGRMTLQGALRYDHAWSVYPEQTVGGTRFLPTPIVFPRTEGVVGFNDVTPRAGIAYDLFGNGKTSVKVNAALCPARSWRSRWGGRSRGMWPT